MQRQPCFIFFSNDGCHSAQFCFNPLLFDVGLEMSAVRTSWNWLKTAWATQPVLVIASVMGMLGKLNPVHIKCLV